MLAMPYTTDALVASPSSLSPDAPAAAAPLHPQSIGSVMTRDVPVSREDETLGALRTSLLGQHFQAVEHVFVVGPDGEFCGALAMAQVLAGAAQDVVRDHMRRDWPRIAPGLDRERAANMALDADAASLAVCAGDGRFLGAVTAGALMTILREEHLEDLHHMAGILGKSQRARDALTASPLRRALFRLPWLAVGIAGCAGATAVMARFEEALAANITVTFFVPAIVYLADAVGTQSEAVAVRGLSLVRTPVRRLLAGEMGTGALIGGALATLAFGLVWASFGEIRLAATVALSVFGASTVATLVGSVLPSAFDWLDYDPALCAGPVGTVIQDVLSLLIYFSIASMLVF
jgi:magnesium transporter